MAEIRVPTLESNASRVKVVDLGGPARPPTLVGR
jgi:hypothetical protein